MANQAFEKPQTLPYQRRMKTPLKTLFASILLLIALCFGAFASVGEKHALGDFGSTQQYVGQNPEANQLASLGIFTNSAESTAECCNATNNGATGANNVNNAVALNRQLTAQEIAGGHGFEKHVLQQGEFSGLGIRTRDQYAAHIENVMNNPSSVRYTTDGRSYHLQESTGTVVVRNPNAADGGTAFQPQNWNEYLTQIPTRTEPY